MTHRPLYIFDLDGTLADITHRLHFIQKTPKDWDGFFAACWNDTPIFRVVQTMRHLMQSGADTWVWSGRDELAIDATRDWLTLHATAGFPVNSRALRLRPHGDHRDDAVLKKEWLYKMRPEDRARLVAVFEDRKRVVDMWREDGVTCYQVAPGDF